MKDYKAVIEECQNILADYITPDSEMNDAECIDKLLGVLDNEDLVKQMRSEYDYASLPMNPNPNLPNWMNGNLDNETAGEPIQDALHAAGFPSDHCIFLTDGILEYIKDAGYNIIKTSQA